jgi:hypothetical protein
MNVAQPSIFGCMALREGNEGEKKPFHKSPLQRTMCKLSYSVGQVRICCLAIQEYNICSWVGEGLFAFCILHFAFCIYTTRVRARRRIPFPS